MSWRFWLVVPICLSAGYLGSWAGLREYFAGEEQSGTELLRYDYYFFDATSRWETACYYFYRPLLAYEAAAWYAEYKHSEGGFELFAGRPMLEGEAEILQVEDTVVWLPITTGKGVFQHQHELLLYDPPMQHAWSFTIEGADELGIRCRIDEIDLIDDFRRLVEVGDRVPFVEVGSPTGW